MIGCGGMGKLHCANAALVTGLKTVAYCDADPAHAEAFLRTYGGEYATADAERLFGDASLDGVLIQAGEALVRRQGRRSRRRPRLAKRLVPQLAHLRPGEVRRQAGAAQMEPLAVLVSGADSFGPNNLVQ